MKNKRNIINLLCLLILFNTPLLFGQKYDNDLNQQRKITTVDSISNKLMANYVFPEVADKMIEYLKSNLNEGAYKNIKDPQGFADKLTEDLRSISKDKHIRVRFDPERIMESEQIQTAQDSLDYITRYVNRLKRSNFGFKEVKILDGNIGYLDLRSFSDTRYAGETATAAMNFLGNTDAIIIDLRFNGGGSPQMIQLITSYLYEGEPVHLNNFYWRPTDSNSQTWTLPHVPGKRNPDAPVFILTSSNTFSAAEEFSYNLKHLKRATLIGETTGGGAHPGGQEIATDWFMIWIPTGRAINPITNTNWEGTGVIPHIETNSSEALVVARMKALEVLKANTDDEAMKQIYDWPLSEFKAMMNPVTIKESVLKSYAGTYGPRVISFENGKLFYQRGDGNKYELKPLNKNEFLLWGMDDFRVKIISKNNKVIALKGLYQSGNTDQHLREKD